MINNNYQLLYLIVIAIVFFFLQNDLHNERKSKIKYIQQCPNWHFVTKKGNIKTIINKVTKHQISMENFYQFDLLYL